MKTYERAGILKALGNNSGSLVRPLAQTQRLPSFEFAEPMAGVVNAVMPLCYLLLARRSGESHRSSIAALAKLDRGQAVASPPPQGRTVPPRASLCAEAFASALGSSARR